MGGGLTAAFLDTWLCFEDESGQGLRPPNGRHLGPLRPYSGGEGDHQPRHARVSLATLIATGPGQKARLICRTARTSARALDDVEGNGLSWSTLTA